jgi:hypothetical protein
MKITPPASRAVPQPTSNAIVVPPVAHVAVPIAKPVVRMSKLYKPKMRRRVAHLTTFRRYGQVMVLPAASEISNKKEPFSFWEKLKRFEPFK